MKRGGLKEHQACLPCQMAIMRYACANRVQYGLTQPFWNWHQGTFIRKIKTMRTSPNQDMSLSTFQAVSPWWPRMKTHLWVFNDVWRLLRDPSRATLASLLCPHPMACWAPLSHIHKPLHLSEISLHRIFLRGLLEVPCTPRTCSVESTFIPHSPLIDGSADDRKSFSNNILRLFLSFQVRI
jgi:hypothetical protein